MGHSIHLTASQRLRSLGIAGPSLSTGSTTSSDLMLIAMLV